MLSWFEHLLKTSVEQYSLLAIYISMTLESACIPIPSEVVMPYAGYLAAKGSLTIPSAAVIGALANLSGSWLAYGVGRFKGRNYLEKYGRYVFLSKKHLKSADKWFAEKGEIAIFMARMLPGIRTFISLPAGIAKMDFLRFSIYSFLGSLPWNFALVYLGSVFTNRWSTLNSLLHKTNVAIFSALAVIGLFYLIHWKVKSNKAESNVENRTK